MRLPFASDEVRAVASRWIAGQAQWTWWVTLTFRTPVTSETAVKLLRRWLRAVAIELAGAHVPVAWTLEWQSSGRPHFHVLLALVAEVSGDELLRLWTRIDRACCARKLARADAFDSSKGAALYMLKGSEWDVNVACPRPPRCRRSRCVKAPSAW